MELNKHNLKQEGEEPEVIEQTQQPPPTPPAEVKEYLQVETPQGLKINLGSTSLYCYELVQLAKELRDEFNGTGKKEAPYTR